MTVKVETFGGLAPELKAAIESLLAKKLEIEDLVSLKTALDSVGADAVTKTYVDAHLALQDTVSTVTATMVADVRSGHIRYSAPIAATTTTFVADVSIANSACTIAAQPDYPRKIQIVITDANSSITAGLVTVIGVGASGQALNQAIDISNGGTHTYTTTDAFASITSITPSGLVGNAAADHISAGPTNALGLPGCKTPTGATFAVYKTDVDNANETVGTVDATAGTITPTTAPNGTHNFDAWYNYTVTEVQASHTHTLS